MTSAHKVIAIDGPAASGKSTLARELAARLNLVVINSGAMYRAVTWKILQLGLDPNDSPAVVAALGKMDLQGGIAGHSSTIRVDGIDPGPALRGAEVNAAVSAIAAIPEVRHKIVALLRKYPQQTDIVMEGRDIGTAVFPETPFKIYVDASAAVRQQRRNAEGVTDAVSSRDQLDSARTAAPLKIAADAAVLDNSTLSIPETVEAALDLLRQQGLCSHT